MRYVDVTLTDVQREFLLTRNHAMHLIPQPKAAATSDHPDRNGVIHALLATQHVMEMFRRSMPQGNARSSLDRLTNRLTKILAQINKLPDS